MRNKLPKFVGMANNISNTYEQAKNIFEQLGLKEDTVINVSGSNVRIFRKHLSEMIKRKKSDCRYATRKIGESLKVIRIQ
jgi:hypothetical protein